METDRRAIARNWVLAQAKRKLEQEQREAEHWAKRPMAHPWNVLLTLPHGERNVRASCSPLAVIKVGENPVGPGQGWRPEGGVETLRLNEALRVGRGLRFPVASLPPVGALRADFPANDQGIALRVGRV